ncbi:hypothetical protein L9F63_000321, partial [Diploptera punctata]
ISENMDYSSKNTVNPMLFLTEVLYLVGMWSKTDIPLYKNLIYRAYTTFVLALIILQSCASVMFCLKEPQLDLHDFIITIFIALGEGSCLTAAFSFIRGQDALKKIFNILEEDFNEYPINMRLKWYRKGRIICIFTVIIWPLWGFIYCVSPVIMSFSEEISNGTSQKVNLPLNSWFPFDSNTSPTFEVLYFLQILAVLTGIVPASVFYAIFMTLSMFIIQQFEFVNNSLRNMK